MAGTGLVVAASFPQFLPALFAANVVLTSHKV